MIEDGKNKKKKPIIAILDRIEKVVKEAVSEDTNLPWMLQDISAIESLLFVIQDSHVETSEKAEAQRRLEDIADYATKHLDRGVGNLARKIISEL